jgi:hypothetical protein
MYHLFMRDGVEQKEEPMTRVFQQFIRDQGMAILEEKRSDIQRLAAEGKKETVADVKMIQQLLQLHAESEAAVQNLFDNNISFQKAMKDAFEFMNVNASEKFTNVELLVSYCDGVLKGKESTDKLDERAMEERWGLVRRPSLVHHPSCGAQVERGHAALQFPHGQGPVR